MWAPEIEDHEALGMQAKHFAECIKKREKPLTDGRAGLGVVKILVASKKSLAGRGMPVELA